jgi:hypothetical protein
MITFQEFIDKTNIILEKYYPPDEPLPSGKSPVQKSKEKLERTPNEPRTPESVKSRRLRLSRTLEKKVKHGSDNPSVNPHSDSGVMVHQSKDKKVTQIEHPGSGIYYTITRLKDIEGKPHHEVDWNVSHSVSGLSQKERIRLANKAKNIYKKNVEDRFPSHSIVSNTPASDTHKDIYKYHRFGDTDDSNRQYASVGRPLSPRQKKKRRSSRLTPLNMR